MHKTWTRCLKLLDFGSIFGNFDCAGLQGRRLPFHVNFAHSLCDGEHIVVITQTANAENGSIYYLHFSKSPANDNISLSCSFKREFYSKKNNMKNGP